MSTATAILVVGAFATAGWLYTARRARTLARKQHTMNVLLTASFDSEFQNAMELLSPYMRTKAMPRLKIDDDSLLAQPLRKVLNHYEFVAAGIRNGDVDETLVRDSERGSILTLFERSTEYIESMRDTRRRRSIYEHLEWLHKRWEKKPPNRFQRFVEFIIGYPIKGRTEQVRT